MADIIFWVVNVLCSVFVIWRVLFLMSMDGKVDMAGRVIMLFALVPVLSVFMAIAFAFVIILFEGGAMIDKWWGSDKMVARRIHWKIRKRRRGPIVRIVEHMHNKRKEKENETDVPEV